MESVEYKGGKRHGETRRYYEDGITHYIDTYENGNKIDRKIYDPFAKLEISLDYPVE